MSAPSDSTTRFSSRVENYVRYRPGYPVGVLSVLEDDAGLTVNSVVADVGSGTGISADLLLRHGNSVYGVEPNAEMRAAAERLLSAYPRFHSLDGTAEATGLPNRSVDLVVAAQAFHWFDPERARREFARILRPEGFVALLWNERLLDTTPFLRGYEALLQRYGTDYREVRHRNVDTDRLRALFTDSAYVLRVLPNRQRFDIEGLRGRLLSSSYTPAEAHPDHVPMLAALERLFAEHQEDGCVSVEYDTQVYVGRVG